MKSYNMKQAIFSVELKRSQSKPRLDYKVEIVANRALRRLEAKLARKQSKPDGKAEP